MIVFDLTCGNDHSFEGWFASAADFDRQQQATQLNCPLCGNTTVHKGLQAPYVNTGSAPQAPQRGKPAPKSAAAAAQYTNIGAEVTRLIEHLIASTEDVGNEFPEEARKIHYQEAPERHIRGNASREEVEELRDEGIEVVAVPVPRHLMDKPH
ncbi:MAG: hypothetical protein JWN94_2985 [Betaproteobacteria bacterium]|nr:hypothetical protein [Betaproteobacteria bacterium]